jgi:hypothetical protein
MIEHYLIAPRWPLLGIAAIVMILVMLPRSRATPWQLARELAIVVPAYVIYFFVRGMVEGREAEAFARATDIIQLERTLGIFWEVDLQWRILREGFLVDMANWIYMWAHWPVILPTAIWLFMLHRDEYKIYRNAFLISGAIALVVYATLPVAPPRLLDAWGFVDTVADHSGALQVMQPAAATNQYAAMPSLHFGWNLLAAIAIFRHTQNVWFKAAAVIMPIVMFSSIVFTGNHFIIDGLAGATVALIALAAALTLRSYFRSREESAKEASGTARAAA